MAEVTARHILYGFLAAAFVIIGGVQFMALLQSSDGGFDSADRTGEFNRTFDKLNDVSANINSMQDSFSADPEWGVFGALNALIKSSWESIKTMFSIVGTTNSVFGGLSSFFGVPSWIVGILGLFITVTVIFAIYSLIFAKDG